MDKILTGRKTKSREVHQTNTSVSSLSAELEGVLCFRKTLTLIGQRLISNMNKSFNFCGIDIKCKCNDNLQTRNAAVH